jgi:hypothetical protein
MTDYLSPDDESRILERLADMIAEFRKEKQRLEFERRLFHVRPPVMQKGFCLT